MIQVIAACGIWCFGFQVFGMVWSGRLCVRFAGCSPQNGHIMHGQNHIKFSKLESSKIFHFIRLFGT